jgi:hypothetical protein
MTVSSGTELDSNVGSSFEPVEDDDVKKLKEKELERKLSDWAQANYIKCKSDITPIRNQWYINLAFFKGDQYVALLRGKLTRAPNVPGRVRMVINKIRPAVRTEISRLTSQKPQASVVPASSEEEDIQSAEAGKNLWEYVYETKDIAKAFADAAFWVSTCGLGYVKTIWDSDADDYEAPNPETQEPSEGDICVTAPTPFNIMVPNSLELDIQRQPYILHVYTMSIEEAKDRWPDVITPDHTPNVVSTNEIMETRYLNLVGAEETAKPDSCLIIEAWVKEGATNLLPEGGMFITCDRRVVYSSLEGLPYDHGDFPFTKLENVPSGTYWTTSVLEDLIPIQKEINRARSQLIENRNSTAKSGYFVQRGSIDVTKWTSRPGQLVEINPGFKEPVPIQVPTMPGYLKDEQQYYSEDFEDISGQHQVSKGQAPSGVTAATAINFLQERDDSYMAPVYKSFERGIQAVAKQVLELCVQFWDEARLVRSVGPNNAISVHLLKGADIKTGTDIRIESGSVLPVSKSAKNAMFMDMITRGIIPEDKGLELMELPNMQSYYEEADADKRAAHRENTVFQTMDPEQVKTTLGIRDVMKQQFLMQNGMQNEQQARSNPTLAQTVDKFDAPIVPVNDWDDDDQHIQAHGLFLKSQTYQTLDPIVQKEAKAHYDAHIAKKQQKMLSQMMMGGTAGGGGQGGPTQGAPGLPPGGSAPPKGPQGGHNAGGNNQFSNPAPAQQGAGQQA